MISEYLRILHSKEALLAQQLRTEDMLEKQIASYEVEAGVLTRALSLCKKCLEDEINLREYVEGVVNAIIQACVGPEVSYRLAPKYDKDGITIIGVVPLVTKDGMELPPVRHGGGMGNLVGIGHRFCFVLLNRYIEPVIFMDEPIVNSDAHKWTALYELMCDLGKDVPFQFIAITHSGAKMGKNYRVEMRNGISHVEEIVD